jgi:hypothetical protein
MNRGVVVIYVACMRIECGVERGLKLEGLRVSPVGTVAERHVQATTEMGMMTRGRATGNGFKVCFRVTCFGNQGRCRDFESLIGRGIVGVRW